MTYLEVIGSKEFQVAFLNITKIINVDLIYKFETKKLLYTSKMEKQNKIKTLCFLLTRWEQHRRAKHFRSKLALLHYLSPRRLKVPATLKIASRLISRNFSAMVRNMKDD